MAKPKLPSRPVYKMFFDGAQTRRIIEWLDRLEGDLGDVDFGNTELNNILQNFSARIVNIESIINGLPNMTTILNRINNLEGSRDQHAQLINNLQGDINGAIQDISDIITRLNGHDGQISTILSRLGVAEGKITTAEGKIATVEGKVTTLEGKVSTLETDVSTIKGDIISVKGRVTTNENDIADLKNRVSDLELSGGGGTPVDLTTINSKITAIEGAIESLINLISAIESCDIESITNQSITSIINTVFA